MTGDAEAPGGPPPPGAAVLCDWNGTLVDDRDRAWQATAATLRVHLAEPVRMPTPATIAATWCLPLSLFFVRLGVGETAVTAAVRTWNREMARRPAVARDGAAPALRALRARGIEVGVVSAGAPELLAADLAATRLATSLDYLCAGVADKATAIRPFVERLGPGRVAYVGDTEEDLYAAARAGAVPIAVLGGYRSAASLRSAAPHATIDDIGDLPAAVEQLLTSSPQPAVP